MRVRRRLRPRRSGQRTALVSERDGQHLTRRPGHGRRALRTVRRATVRVEPIVRQRARGAAALVVRVRNRLLSDAFEFRRDQFVDGVSRGGMMLRSGCGNSLSFSGLLPRFLEMPAWRVCEFFFVFVWYGT